MRANFSGTVRGGLKRVPNEFQTHRSQKNGLKWRAEFWDGNRDFIDLPNELIIIFNLKFDRSENGRNSNFSFQ